MEKQIKIRTLDKHVIYGMLNWQGETDSLIIFIHGISAYIDDEPFFNASRFFPKKGFATARISLYSHEKNARKLMSSTIKDHANDIQTVVKYFKKKYSKIYLIGHSLGGPCILLSNLGNDLLSGIVLWDPSNSDSTFEETLITENGIIYTNWGIQIILHQKMVDEWIELRKHLFSMAEKIQTPMKVICAGNGILWEKWEEYFAVNHTCQEFVKIEGADHSFYEEGAQEKLFIETLKFLRKIP